ncbi:MAG TPA: MGMT family protein [Propionicimonas sp.]|jgi:alkylated DNA nucleotide flippase Atl1|uniref:MGMT family protein n=1 Tax=Propionicimonas sp. TaxID=1955623 RepID=UPI002F42206C
MAPSMAELADSILMVTDAIPPGQVSTYGDIAKVVGCGPRLVARVLAGSGGQVRWWRVVRSNGTIAEQLVAEASTHLAAEGVPVRAGRVDLKLHRAALD